MAQIRLTKQKIDTIPFAPTGQVLYRDDQLRGFGLRVGKRSKVFFVEGQVDRRTVRVTIGPYGPITPERARRLALKRLGEMAEGRNPNALSRERRFRSTTVKDAFDHYFEAKGNLADKTIADYRRTSRVYLKAWRHEPISSINRQMVLRAHKRVSDDHGPIAANNAFRHFRAVYNFTASTQDEFPANPVQILSLARAWWPERRRRRVISARQLPNWWKVVVSEPECIRDFLLLALFTGMRRSEIATLRWDNIDLFGQAFHLPKTKNGDPLDLPMSDFVGELIGRRREIVGQSEWVFPGRGKTGHIVETKSFVRRVSEQSAVPFAMHDLRRSFITIAESLDIPAYALKRLLNHRADTDVTGGYIVIDVERLREPVQRIADRILEIVHGDPFGCSPK